MHPVDERKPAGMQRGPRLGRGLIAAVLALCTGAMLRAQGPPYQTDDPAPVDLHHYEFYIFGGVDGTTAEIDSTGPAFEFNWGALPRVRFCCWRWACCSRFRRWGIGSEKGICVVSCSPRSQKRDLGHPFSC
jgi:hypothetical protein